MGRAPQVDSHFAAISIRGFLFAGAWHMTAFTRTSPGEPRNHYAAEHNAFLDMWQDFKTKQNDRETFRHARGAYWTLPIVAAEDFAENGIVALGDPVDTTDDDNLRTRAVACDGELATNSHWLFGIVEDGCDTGDTALAIVGGVARVDIDVQHASQIYAGLKTGDKTQLESSFVGPARILWKESGTGTKKAIIMFPVSEVQEVAGVMDAAITVGGPDKLVSVYLNDIDTGENITVRLPNNWPHSGQGISAGKKVNCRWMPVEKIWVPEAADCE